ncbi:MAG: helix-turn-helix domain-containing protein [Clostridia bacterium]|nr:helix-turn-helix domain-containing protein [Clostridia bacterium]
MEFEEILFRAKHGDKKSVERILEMFRPMLIRNALIKGVFEEDLYQEYVIETLKCIRNFRKIDLLDSEI